MTQASVKCKVFTNWKDHRRASAADLGTQPLKRKQTGDDILESSIFDLLDNSFQIGDLVWAKLDCYSWWPAFIYGCYSDKWQHVKIITKSESMLKKKYFVYCFGQHFKYSWVHQAHIHRYQGLEEFLNYSEQQAEQATDKDKERQIRKRFQINMSEELHSSWRQAIKEANHFLLKSRDVRLSVFEKRLRDFLPEIQSFPSSQVLSGKEQLMPSDYSLGDVSTQEQEVVRLQAPAKCSSSSLTTAICHFLDKGLPSLTMYEEVRLMNELMHHPLGSSFTLNDAQLFVEQYVINIARTNYSHRMSFVQSDFFYDFLLKYPRVILKHRHWFPNFQPTLMPSQTDRLQLKKWQLATLLHAHINLEQRLH